MTKIFEALQQAENERQNRGDERTNSLGSMHHDTRYGSLSCNSESLSNSMVNLYQYVVTALPYLDCRTISFNESRFNEGSSVLCREFAKVLVSQLGKKVLVLDFSEHNMGAASYFNIRSAMLTAQDAAEPSADSDAIYNVEGSTLYVCKGSVERDVNYEPLLDSLRKDYDMILLDMPPVSRNPGSILISQYVDGVILVVESEKTRWQVANKTVKSIQTHNGNMLGVILSKQQYHIPQFIYNHL